MTVMDWHAEVKEYKQNYDDDGGITKGLIDGTMMWRSYITPNNFGLLITGNQLTLLGKLIDVIQKEKKEG